MHVTTHIRITSNMLITLTKLYSYVYVPTTSRISLILHKAEVRPSVNIKDILQVLVRFNLLLSHKGVVPF